MSLNTTSPSSPCWNYQSGPHLGGKGPWLKVPPLEVQIQRCLLPPWSSKVPFSLHIHCLFIPEKKWILTPVGNPHIYRWNIPEEHTTTLLARHDSRAAVLPQNSCNDKGVPPEPQDAAPTETATALTARTQPFPGGWRAPPALVPLPMRPRNWKSPPTTVPRPRSQDHEADSWAVTWQFGVNVLFPPTRGLQCRCCEPRLAKWTHPKTKLMTRRPGKELGLFSLLGDLLCHRSAHGSSNGVSRDDLPDVKVWFLQPTHSDAPPQLHPRFFIEIPRTWIQISARGVLKWGDSRFPTCSPWTVIRGA